MTVMQWTYDPNSTKKADGVFPGYRPRVARSGKHYRLDESPYGRIEIISMRGWFLIAANAPPEVASPADLDCLSKDIIRHLQRERPPLVPWKIVPGTSLDQVLRHLNRRGPEEKAQALAPYVVPYDAPRGQALCGENRRTAAERLAGWIAAQRPGAPLPAVTGLPGIGKHRLAAAAAEQLQVNTLEMPLRRVLLPRMLQTSSELFLEVMVAVQRTEGALLIVAEAELLGRIPSTRRRMFLAELSLVPRVVLLVTQPPQVSVGGLIAMECPALATAAEAREMLAAAYPDLEIVPQALEMAVRAASVPGIGVVPGRLLHLVGLGLSLGGATDPPTQFTPDDAAPAAPLVERTWTVPEEEADE